MNALSLREYCLSKKGTKETLPFGDDVLVIKVLSKMFALIAIEDDVPRVNLKCDPVLASELRRRYKSIKPGYHMNKQHWNSVYLDGSIADEEIFRMIDHSYDLVVKGLKKSEKDQLNHFK